MTAGARLTLELNDLGLGVAGDASLASLAPAPGVALVEGREIVTGAEAAARARLAPRSSRRGFWAELGLQPLGPPFPAGLRSADLAFAQLEELWRQVRERLDGAAPAAAVLLAPPAFSTEQLSLALGIARRAGWPIEGIVDAALAAALGTSATASTVVHLDVELARATATTLTLADDVLARRRVVTDVRAGRAALDDVWAREIGRRFVRSTRFDPLHAAASEQQLYSRLAGWVEGLASAESVAAKLVGTGREHAIDLERELLIAAAAEIYERIAGLAEAASAGGATLLLSHRVLALPGLEPRLASAGLEIVRLAAGGAAATALERFAEIAHAGAEALPRVTRLPVAAGSA